MLVSGEGLGERADTAVTGPLTAAVDGLLEVDPDTLDDAELAEAMVALHRQQARLAAATARLTATFEARRVWVDDGSRSCGAWVAQRCRLPIGQARAGVWLGRRLRAMPATAEVFAAGDISQRHAMVLASFGGGPYGGVLRARRGDAGRFRSHDGVGGFLSGAGVLASARRPRRRGAGRCS
jgi:Domain of unknown function (DUF222)